MKAIGKRMNTNTHTQKISKSSPQIINFKKKPFNI